MHDHSANIVPLQSQFPTSKAWVWPIIIIGLTFIILSFIFITSAQFKNQSRNDLKRELNNVLSTIQGALHSKSSKSPV